MIYNGGSTTLNVKFGTTASATSFTVQIAVGGYYELPLPLYCGKVDGIWTGSPTGNAQVTEY